MDFLRLCEYYKTTLGQLKVVWGTGFTVYVQALFSGWARILATFSPTTKGIWTPSRNPFHTCPHSSICTTLPWLEPASSRLHWPPAVSLHPASLPVVHFSPCGSPPVRPVWSWPSRARSGLHGLHGFPLSLVWPQRLPVFSSSSSAPLASLPAPSLPPPTLQLSYLSFLPESFYFRALTQVIPCTLGILPKLG